MMLKRLIRFAGAVLLAGWAAQADAQEGARVALVIGNVAYSAAPPLRQAAEARSIADALANGGWAVEGEGAALNLSRAQLLQKLTEFAARAQDADEALLYFAGYAVSIDGADYLTPVDLRPQTAAELKEQSVNLEALLPAIKPAYGRLTIILDAPSPRKFSGVRAKGLSRIARPSGVDIIYAEQPGGAAEARPELLGPKIAKALALGLDFGAALLKARESVATATHGQQRPLLDVDWLDQRPMPKGQAAPQPTESASASEGSGAASPPPAQDVQKPFIAESSKEAAAAPAQTEVFKTVQVFYATDRNAVTDAKTGAGFGSARGDGVSYGTCLVTVPKDHRIGELEAPNALRFQFSQDPARHVILQRAELLPAPVFFSKLSERVASEPGRSAFIFIHGYNVSFADAARRTAQMSYDLKFRGAPVFFSWPSTASYSGYGADEGNVDYSRRHLTEFIKDFVDKSGADNIYLIAHSMGNRALTGALGELFSAEPAIKSKIREIILAAPDIDAQVFKEDIAPKFAGAGVPVTLYASSNDWALWVSKFWHEYARAGDSGAGLTLVPGVSTIDSSAVDTSFLGHSYYAESTSVIADIFNILRGQFDPARRPNLAEKDATDGKYWVMEK